MDRSELERYKLYFEHEEDDPLIIMRNYFNRLYREKIKQREERRSARNQTRRSESGRN